MKAVIRYEYGSPDVLRLQDVDTPVAEADEVLVRVRACAVNPFDWHTLTGTPYLARIGGVLKPKSEELGVDFAGTVEAAGGTVTQLQVGDEVFGARSGAFAEYVCVPEDRAAVKPANLSFEQAAAVPVAALTALQGLRDHGQLRPGHKVLINGASGGVGTFAVQIAKTLGAEVTGVCSMRNIEQARSLGADHVIDYTHEDFTRGDRRYDLMLDIAGSRTWSELRRVLNPEARLVIVGGPKTNRLIGPLDHVLKVRLASLRSSQKVGFFITKMNEPDLMVVRELIEAGKVTPVIDRRYELTEIADALRYMGEGHAQGKIVVAV